MTTRACAPIGATGLDDLFGPNDGDARAFVGLSPWFSVRPDVEPAVGLTLRFGIATY